MGRGAVMAPILTTTVQIEVVDNVRGHRGLHLGSGGWDRDHHCPKSPSMKSRRERESNRSHGGSVTSLHWHRGGHLIGPHRHIGGRQ
ncbi:hypothetical protein CRG98_030983 [Punica granatum]|uniref:Uncharacterized protein n=1 Tax=Punica granatum TaxID=22663 RepID=A0A2I0IX96_PUNGR|nr:hypothetical protein CRG98_030983 [Punica granatum]